MEHIKFSGFVKAEYPHSDNCRVIFPPNSIGFLVFVPYVWHCTWPLFINHILLQFQYIQSQAELSSLDYQHWNTWLQKFNCHINFCNLFFLSCNNASYYHHNWSSLLVDFFVAFIIAFFCSKNKVQKSLLYEKYTIKYLAKKYKKKRIYHNCAELVRQTVLYGCYNIYRSLKRE